MTSNFSFSHSVFKRLVTQGRQKASLCGNGLSDTAFILHMCIPHTDQREPQTPYVLNTPDQIFHGRNRGGVSIFIFYGPD